ncbi:hypothetical protein AB833_20205 [Chromatiales bacterium (ex Bugula neritina AB1)]|nr:hypothetical protein AB833_20205 [Chromatiales bacterium (ex Bugula neritina AB1)]
MMAKETQILDEAEQLSAFMDGELAGDAGVFSSFIGSNQSQRNRWQRYHLARDVMQRDYTPALSADFSAELARKLDLEDLPVQAANNIRSARNVASLSSRSRRPGAQSYVQPRATLRNWISSAGLAMAASAAALFVGVNFSGNNQPSISQSVAQLPAEQIEVPVTTIPQNHILPAVLVTDVGTRWRGTDESSPDTLVSQRLNSYLTNHLEDTAMTKVHGMLAHSRVVSYDLLSGSNESF